MSKYIFSFGDKKTQKISNARNILVTGDVSAQSFSVDGQTLFNTSNILGRVAANNFVTADANRDISKYRCLYLF